jgi:hypothetical protein
MRTALRSFIFFICVATGHKEINGQTGTSYDLVQLFKDQKLTVYNRAVSFETDASKKGIALSEEEGEGLVWINGVSFSTGTIEVDLKGQDVFQHSFVGIAFHCADDSTFDAIYFRPFQFNSIDPERKKRGVQYVSLPAYTWQKLREQQNGFYENLVAPAPDPNDWFHVKIIVKEKDVQVYANNAATPCLRINLLNERKSGKIALYTADRSGGSFANLVIQSN